MTESSLDREGNVAGDASLLALGITLLRWRRTVIALALAGGVLGLAVSLSAHRVYSSSAIFIPQASDAMAASGLALAASQLGIRVPAGTNSWGPPVYVELLRSRAVLMPMAEESVTVTERGGERVALLDLFKIKAPTPELRIERGVVALRAIISANDDKQLGAVMLTVTTRWPSVSLFLAEGLVSRVNQFNLESRRTQAAAERQFVETQASEAERALREAEDRLRTFLLRNRSISEPDLEFTRDRLRREVDLRQQVYTTLVQSRDEARIREVRDTPVITVLERPRLPAVPESRRAALKGVLGGIAGTILGLVLVLAAQRMAEVRRTTTDDAREFRQLLRGATPRFLRREDPS